MSKVLRGVEAGAYGWSATRTAADGRGMHRLLGNPERISHLSIGQRAGRRNLGVVTPPGDDGGMDLWYPPDDQAPLLEWWTPLAAGGVRRPAGAGAVADPPRRLHADGPGRSGHRARPCGSTSTATPVRELNLDDTGQAYKFTRTPNGHRLRALHGRATSARRSTGPTSRPSSRPSGTTSRRRAAVAARGLAPGRPRTSHHATPPLRRRGDRPPGGGRAALRTPAAVTSPSSRAAARPAG